MSSGSPPTQRNAAAPRPADPNRAAPACAAPPGWRPQDAISAAFPAMARFADAAQTDLRAVEARLDRDELSGLDTASLRLVLRELHWRLEYTADIAAAAAALARLRRLALPPAPTAGPVLDAEGSYGAASDVWFLKLDASVDHWLAEAAPGPTAPPRLLDRINDPGRLAEYLDGLLVSRPAIDGVDRRKELNFATAGLVRLILRRRPPGYPWHPQLATVIRRFVARWQDRDTGFFGADYEIGGLRYRTADLSLTFHMARYLDGKIGFWPRLIDTLLAMRDRRYPHGWLDEGGMTSHNNYDVAVLFGLGWSAMRPDQRRAGQRELRRLLDWCLDTAIAADGTVTARAAAESLPESYYFTIAFLEAVGYFEPRKRFWTDRPFPEAPALRQRLERRLAELDPRQPMTQMALDRLRGGEVFPQPAAASA
jgi:hypothetical protein